jgi:polar amino acid transport system substrate-binding protein
MRIKSALLALIAGAAIVASACGGATEPVASGEARFPEGSYCAQALALGEDVTGTLLWKVCDEGKIVMATDPAYPPYSEIDASGEYVGFDSDTSREVAKRLGVEVEWATPAWAAITAGNWGGRWDISIGSMTQTEERALVVDFADPYFYESGYLLVPTDSTAMTVADLAGKTICAGEATTHSSWIEGEFADSTTVDQYNEPPAGAKLKTYETDFMCIQAYLDGRTNDWDAMAQSREFIEDAISKSDGKLRFLDEKANFAGRISFALDKSGPSTASMLNALNAIVAEMHEDGTLSGFAMKHVKRDISKP